MQTTSLPHPVVSPDQRPVPRHGYKLDAARKVRICDVVAMGGTLQTAAKIVGCTQRAIYYAAQRDPAFGERLKTCRTDAIFSSVKTMNDAIKSAKSWRAAFCILRDRYPGDYARKANVVPIRKVCKMIEKIRNAVENASISEKTREQIENRFDNILARFGQETADPFETDELSDEL